MRSSFVTTCLPADCTTAGASLSTLERLVTIGPFFVTLHHETRAGRIHLSVLSGRPFSLSRAPRAEQPRRIRDVSADRAQRDDEAESPPRPRGHENRVRVQAGPSARRAQCAALPLQCHGEPHAPLTKGSRSSFTAGGSAETRARKPRARRRGWDICGSSTFSGGYAAWVAIRL